MKEQSKNRPFPEAGYVRATEGAKYLTIGLSTFWLWVKQGKLPRPLKLGARTSVWKAEELRDLAENGFKGGVE